MARVSAARDIPRGDEGGDSPMVVRERTNGDAAVSGQWSIIHPFGRPRHRRSIVFQRTPPRAISRGDVTQNGC